MIKRDNITRSAYLIFQNMPKIQILYSTSVILICVVILYLLEFDRKALPKIVSLLSNLKCY